MRKSIQIQSKSKETIILKQGEIEKIGNYTLSEEIEYGQKKYVATIKNGLYPYPKGYYTEQEMKEMLNDSNKLKERISSLWSGWLIAFYDD